MMLRSLRLVRSPQLTSRACYASAAIQSVEGIKVLAQDSGAPTSTLALIAKAGSRHETKLGLSHYLKNFAFKNTTKKTAFRITRETELQGGSLSALMSREHIIYTAQFFREDAPYFLELLSDVVQHTKYSDYEGVDIAQKVALEANLATPETLVLNGLHKEAFRTGLGNSTLALPHSGINTEDISGYSKKVLSQDRLTFVGLNVDSALISKDLSKHFASPSSSALSSPVTKYFGGESRVEASSASEHFAIAFEGAKYGSELEASLIVLQNLLGGQIHMKWGSGVSPLSKIASSHNAQVSAFNFSYADSGLFGIYVTSSSNVADTVNSALAELRKLSSSVDAEDLKRAIAKAKFSAISSDDSLSKAIALGTQASLLGKVLSAEESISRFNSVSEKSISEVAKKLVSSKPTTAAYGRLSSLPYLDELKL